MSSQSVFLFAMIGILLVCGYAYLYQMVACRASHLVKMPVLAVVLLFAYGMVTVPVIYIVSSLGSMEMLVFTLMMLVACIILCIAFCGLIQNIQQINKGMLALFLVYILVMAYITLFSREFDKETAVYIFRTDLISEAIRTGSFAPMSHMLLNVAMFIPLGAMLPFVYPEKLDKWGVVLPLALMITTLIETIQFFLRLGQADLTDIVTNVLGAAVGFLGYRLFRRFSPF